MNACIFQVCGVGIYSNVSILRRIPLAWLDVFEDRVSHIDAGPRICNLTILVLDKLLYKKKLTDVK